MPLAPVFCTIMSTLMPRSASSRNSCGGDARTVRDALDRDLRLRGVVGDGRDDGLFHRGVLLHDPGAGLPGEARSDVQRHAVAARELDRAQHETRPPVAAISIISSKETCARRRAVGTTRGSAEKTPGHVGVDLAHVCLQRSRQGDGGDVGAAAPQRRDVPLGGHALKPRDDGNQSRVERLAEPVGPDLEDLGAGVVGVGDDPRLAAGEGRRSHAAVGQRHAHQRHRDPLAGREQHVELARRVASARRRPRAGSGRRSNLPIAETTTTTSSPAARVRATWSATSRIRSASPTEVPPYF